MRAFGKVIGFILCASPASIGIGQDVLDWVQAEKDIVRLSPSSLETLPSAVRTELERRGCTIPQASSAGRLSGPQNVISGHFHSTEQTDFAVLCSRNGLSSILVFAAGDTDPVAELAPAPDRNYLQVVLPGQVKFSRELRVASAETIERSQQNYGGEAAFTLTHDGIEDIFEEKASTHWYWHESEWHQLRGAD